jgi:hypothetical protein
LPPAGQDGGQSGNGGKLRFPACGTARADCPATGKRHILKGNKTMAKMESFTFSLGLMLSGLLIIATITPVA